MTAPNSSEAAAHEAHYRERRLLRPSWPAYADLQRATHKAYIADLMRAACPADTCHACICPTTLAPLGLELLRGRVSLDQISKHQVGKARNPRSHDHTPCPDNRHVYWSTVVSIVTSFIMAIVSPNVSPGSSYQAIISKFQFGTLHLPPR